MNIFVDSLLLFLLIMRYHSQLLALTALLLSVTVSPAQTTRADIFNNPSLAAVVYLPYPAPTTPLTPAPEEYKPFYISHVGRHGSRYMVSNEYYHHTIDLLSKAERDKVLTPLGKETLAKLRIAYADAHGKAGMLSTLGGQQHEQIASRMYRNFPEVFTDNSFVDARSTLVNRCMQSMAHFCTQLQLLNKDLDISQRTRKKDQYFLSNNKDSAQAAPTNKEVRQRVIHYMDSLNQSNRVVYRLISRESWIRKHVKRPGQVGFDLYQIWGNMLCQPQLHLDFTDAFERNELFQFFQAENVRWVLRRGIIPGLTPRYQYIYPLVNNIVSWADEVIRHGKTGAHLRFAHDTQVYPLAFVLRFSGYGQRPTANLDSLNFYTSADRVVPMASNIQFIFYRKKGSDDILVKILFLEKEQHIPLATDQWPYYHWRDLRAYMKRQATR